ncbi:glycerophosphodiester phosphodiesterase [Mesobacillus maritimus]|uniref:glycerophosphodiester phosphodiesterase n=1 Tax=Mesobacillus maritimus TaxID=1643336 RepID=UPI00203D8443|nr:glycerophosphodiester phosphodiesterase [Mesobacillus maritimus]MCM3586684.1 glycerophosphodiester phosphodiesterase [Mesobacillus maritimus]MCM3668562.1 glycerophosphodiester phosphodiesterase [Mesobacillus maritimus]
MKGKWIPVVGAVALGLSLSFGGDVAMAKEKYKEIVNVSHRGASGLAPEHTLVAYKMGEKMHGDYIEVDLQMTKDGHLIAMHDERVDRTTDGTGLVKDMTLEEIKELDAGTWFNETYTQYANPNFEDLQVPTLEEVFQTFGKNKSYYIETKSPDVYPGMEEELLRLVNEYRIDKDKLLVQSFSKESLIKMNELDPTVKLVQLLSYRANAEISKEDINEIKEYAIGVGPNHTYLTEEYVQTIVSSGLELHPYTVNEKERMKQLIDWGVTGMFTNFPNLLHEVKKGK